MIKVKKRHIGRGINQNTSLANAQKMFSESHKKVMSLVEKYSIKENEDTSNV